LEKKRTGPIPFQHLKEDETDLGMCL